MSLTAFQRYRRMKQVEEMKPENIARNNEVPEVQETAAPVEEAQPKTEEAKEETTRRRRRTTEE